MWTELDFVKREDSSDVDHILSCKIREIFNVRIEHVGYSFAINLRVAYEYKCAYCLSEEMRVRTPVTIFRRNGGIFYLQGIFMGFMCRWL